MFTALDVDVAEAGVADCAEAKTPAKRTQPMSATGRFPPSDEERIADDGRTRTPENRATLLRRNPTPFLRSINPRLARLTLLRKISTKQFAVSPAAQLEVDYRRDEHQSLAISSLPIQSHFCPFLDAYRRSRRGAIPGAACCRAV